MIQHNARLDFKKYLSIRMIKRENGDIGFKSFPTSQCNSLSG